MRPVFVGAARAALALAFALVSAGCDANAVEDEDMGGPSPTPTTTGTTPMPAPTTMEPQPEAPPNALYRVVGNQILGPGGAPKHFHGVSRPSLEWSAQGESLSANDFAIIKSWGANVVRVPLNQTFWGSQPAYQAKVDEIVNQILAQSMDVILDLHWSENGAGQSGQQCMANQNSLAFWQQVANKYKAQERVLFELYNEPHDVTWDIWRNGGQITATACGAPWRAVGMQQMVDVIRGTGANNIVIAGGLDFAYDLSGFLTHALRGYNIAYATHPYDHANKLKTAWENDWGFVAARAPVFVSEFGITAQGVSAAACGATTYYMDVITYAMSKGAHWIAWAWYPKDCAFPSLIRNYGGEPTEAGAIVRQALAQLPP